SGHDIVVLSPKSLQCTSLAQALRRSGYAGLRSPSKIISSQLDRFLEGCVCLRWTTCVAVVREFCKEEVPMQETKRMTEEANRMGQEAQERVQSGFEAASRSFSVTILPRT